MLKQIIIISIVVIVVISIFAFIKFKTKNNEVSSNTNNSISVNNNARIDICNFGKKGNTVSILEKKPSNMQISTFDSTPGVTKEGIRTILSFGTGSDWQTGEIKFKTKGDGLISIEFMGPYVPDEQGKPEKILAEYRNVSINDSVIFTENKTLWHDEREYFESSANDGEIFTLKFEYKMP